VKTNNSLSRASQIRNLLLVFGSGIGLAVVLALVSLYYYNPSGSYLVNNVLLSPESLKAIRFSEGSSRQGGTARFVFDSLEFSFYDPSLKKWEKKPISLDQYSLFYSTISNQKSILEVPKDVENDFHKLSLLILALKVHVDGPSTAQTPATIISSIEFIERDYYRIQLREQAEGPGKWVYFHQPGIYKKVFKLFTTTS
jgi:hypothetical protein